MIPRERDRPGLASKRFKKDGAHFFWLVYEMTRGPVTFGLCHQLLSIIIDIRIYDEVSATVYNYGYTNI